MFLHSKLGELGKAAQPGRLVTGLGGAVRMGRGGRRVWKVFHDGDAAAFAEHN